VRSVYVARTSHASAARQQAETDRFRAGEVVPGRLYILIDNERVPAPLMFQARPLDGVTILFVPKG
jgi:hypothetical protein